jgi:hypothetical protein
MDRLLSGDLVDPAAGPATSVVGILRDELVPAVMPLDALAGLGGTYKRTALDLDSAPWGAV